MSGAVTKLTVFNMALAELQQEPVGDVNDTGFNASILRLYYDSALDSALKASSWDFATKYVQLTLQSEADNITPFQYLYQLPADFLEFQELYDAYGNQVTYQNTYEGLRAKSKPVYLRYTFRNENFGSYDTTFCQALAFSLADLASSRILGSLNREDYLEGRAGREQMKALNKSVGKNNQSYKISSTWVNTHNSMTNG